MTAYIKKPISIKGVVIEGYQVASGQALDNPYPKGSIELQVPFFKQLGLDLTSFYSATLNISILPNHIKLLIADYHFKQLLWINSIPAEDFSFVRANLILAEQKYHGFWYYPHPNTKPDHQHTDSVVEFIGIKIDNIHYGSEVELQFEASKVVIS